MTQPSFAPVQAAPPSQVWIDAERRWAETDRYDVKFRDAIKAAIDQIALTAVGATVLRALKRERTLITLYENMPKDAIEPSKRAVASTYSDLDGLAAGELLGTRSTSPTDGPRGTGLGCPSTVYVRLQRSRAHPAGLDGVLVHELAHAMRAAWGEGRVRPAFSLPVARRFRFPKPEEFFAQAIMNMYLVERGRNPIVGYDPRAPGFIPKRGPEGRSARMREAVENKVRLEEQRYLRGIIARTSSMRGVINELATLRVPYNPFRDVDRPDARTHLPATY
ncbi:MAG: hypothetical protein H6719_02040 [Sandaracinaceae bacterium]|nr:hypothetical protein [Sandaracinaceae bacterium]